MTVSLSDIANKVAVAEPVLPVTQPVVAGRRLFIDADMLAYFCSGNEDVSITTARSILRNTINKFKELASADSVVLGLTASGSLKGLRVLVPTSQPYQAQRSGAKRPKNWEALRDYMLSGAAGTFIAATDREADDMAGWFYTKHGENAVLCSGDKDFRMIPGWHLDWVHKQMVHIPNDCYEVEHFGKVYGYKWFLLQMLQGDTADHIRGLGKCKAAPRGCGEATAKKLLQDTTCKAEGIARVVELYKAAFEERWANEFAEQAMLLWIRRGSQATLDEFRAYTPMPTEEDRREIGQAVKAIKLRIREMQMEAGGLLQ